MAAEELIARLERDAEHRIAALREKGGAEAQALLDEAARRRAEVERHGLEARRVELAARYERELSATRQRVRAERLGALHAAIGRVFARARELFDEVGGSPQYAPGVARQTAEVLRFVEGLEVTVRCRPELAAALLKVAPSLAVDPQMGWGVKVVAAGGAVTLDETLEARLDREAPRLAVALRKELGV